MNQNWENIFNPWCIFFYFVLSLQASWSPQNSFQVVKIWWYYHTMKKSRIKWLITLNLFTKWEEIWRFIQTSVKPHTKEKCRNSSGAHVLDFIDIKAIDMHIDFEYLTVWSKSLYMHLACEHNSRVNLFHQLLRRVWARGQSQPSYERWLSSCRQFKKNIKNPLTSFPPCWALPDDGLDKNTESHLLTGFSGVARAVQFIKTSSSVF